MDGGDDDMDSLFEGMELFTPASQLDDNCDKKLSSSSITPPTQSEDNETKAAEAEATAPQPDVTEALDENLFSDLTIVTPVQHQPEPIESVITTTHPSPAKSDGRQVSRRKKRAGGLRIGYGRHEINNLDEDEDDSVSQQSDSVSQVSDSVSQVSDSVAQVFDSGNQSLDSSTPPADVAVVVSNGSSRLELVKAQIKTKLNRARDLAASVTSARKSAIKKRRQASENLRLASTKHEELEKQLEEAIETEDFDAAERISESLAAKERDRLALLALLRQAESDCDAIESRMEKVLVSQIEAEEESASLLRTFCTDAENDAGSILDTAEAFCSDEMEKWHSCSEDVEVRKFELGIESVVVDNVRLSLNGTLEGSVEQDIKEKEMLRKKKEQLSDELEELLALVKAKEKEIDENNLQIEAVEERINNVVSGYKELQTSLDSMLNNVQAGLTQIEKETEDLSMKKREVDEFVAAEKERGAKLRDLVRVSADEACEYEEVIKLRKGLMLYVSKTREERGKLVNIEEKLSEEVQMLQEEVSSTRELLKERSSKKSIIQQNITSFSDKIMFIEKRMPELEAEKKVAASTRNFKEAGRIAAEAKSLNLEKDKIQMETGKANAELEKAEHEIEETIKRLQEIEVLILSKEKELAISRFQRLRIDSGTAKAESSAALELSDLEEANLLLEEAQEAESEAEKLKLTCGLKEEEGEEEAKSYEVFVSMELIATVGLKKLQELAESVPS
ncbi:PREDICTED: cilia- and flagella-associated protein 58-like [Camelina sativa]|uniref:Cilia- and flagella-associated protein 58-like n=1 Tax=Camelina sativa TaxID=90675 RepID=A0ABM0T5Y0_CAMSA|nr:PREDICTED: cilia- and flagella-associated protein 58-like [Camelina sativa]